MHVGCTLLKTSSADIYEQANEFTFKIKPQLQSQKKHQIIYLWPLGTIVLIKGQKENNRDPLKLLGSLTVHMFMLYDIITAQLAQGHFRGLMNEKMSCLGLFPLPQKRKFLHQEVLFYSNTIYFILKEKKPEIDLLFNVATLTANQRQQHSWLP